MRAFTQNATVDCTFGITQQHTNVDIDIDGCARRRIVRRVTTQVVVVVVVIVKDEVDRWRRVAARTSCDLAAKAQRKEVIDSLSLHVV